MTDTERQAYEQKMDARLMKWDAQMQELKARAKEAGADAKVEIARELDELEKRSDAAREKLRLLGVTAGQIARIESEGTPSDHRCRAGWRRRNRGSISSQSAAGRCLVAWLPGQPGSVRRNNRFPPRP